jgi:regulator of sigma E protease
VAALISLNLGLLNLLPVPLLDGGQAALVIVEAVRRRPVSPRARERATIAGVMVLAALMLLALRNDLARHLSGMFH